MADNDQLLDNIGNLIDQKLEPLKKDMATKADVQPVEQGQAQIQTTLGQITTAVNALAAGQKDQASKGDIQRLEQKIDKVAKDVKSHRDRIENLEEHTGVGNPHKN
jgi:hypothetical protein